MKKILFVVTSHDKLGNTGKPTGYYVSEVTHPYHVLSRDYEIDIVSPQGGKAPEEGLDLTDPITKEVWEDAKFQSKITNTLTPDKVNPDEYCAIFYAGGHGVMWDFPENKTLADICKKIYEAGGVVSAVCHGPAGLVNVTLSDGTPLIKDKHINAFTNIEEDLNGTSSAVPFMLQTTLLDKDCIFEQMKPWSNFTVVDGRIITGQNPMSALTVGYKVAAKLSSL